MRTFVINSLLSLFLSWFIFNAYGNIPVNALFAFLIYAAWFVFLWLFSFFYDQKYFLIIPKIIAFILFYFKEVVVASVKIVYDVITIKSYMHPGVISFPLDVKTDLGITLLANFITLTPGSLSIDISEDRKTLFIHDVYIKNGDLERRKQEIKENIEKRIINMLK